MVRYISADNKTAEHAIGLIEAKAVRSASGKLKLIETSIKDNDLNFGSIASQCYDGASVMSGEKGGLQKLLSDKCSRSILYINCYCHKLHLVVNAIKDNVRG